MESNGRIDLLKLPSGTPLFLQEKVKSVDKTYFSNALKHTLQNSKLSVLFFSVANVTIIENGIKAAVYKLSNNTHIIDTQDYDQLYIIMRSTFLQYSLNHPDNITQQIEVLNSRVVSHCAPKIYSEIESYMKYKKDSSTLISPLDMPTYIHKDKGLEFKGFF
jgi:hypothetical protein